MMMTLMNPLNMKSNSEARITTFEELNLAKQKQQPEKNAASTQGNARQFFESGGHRQPAVGIEVLFASEYTRISDEGQQHRNLQRSGKVL